MDGFSLIGFSRPEIVAFLWSIEEAATLRESAVFIEAGILINGVAKAVVSALDELGMGEFWTTDGGHNLSGITCRVRVALNSSPRELASLAPSPFSWAFVSGEAIGDVAPKVAGGGFLLAHSVRRRSEIIRRMFDEPLFHGSFRVYRKSR